MSEEQRLPEDAYSATVALKHNVGTIGVPCLGCTLDIGQYDYVMIAAKTRGGVFLLHTACATLLSEGIDAALASVAIPASWKWS